jgi:hypothetical protein
MLIGRGIYLVPEQIQILLDEPVKIVRERGRIDDWLITVDGKWVKDEDYFQWLLNLTQFFEENVLYDLFVDVYNCVGFQFDKNFYSIELPYLIEKRLGNIWYSASDIYEEVFKVYAVLYAVLLAEQNRFYKDTNRIYPVPVKKRIKRLGVFQILKLGMSANEAARYSKKSKDELLQEVHNLICTKAQAGTYCKKLETCLYKHYGNRKSLYLIEICNLYGF